ncbi:rhodanese-like domain-containing protein [Lewinella sp. IMCC34191]|uniref:rhodanese-like domain-containing protein n=1 Tax=Lewinella sp. IMCC34191 TaxID=2259172 RepID=UPI000E273173|nr:rhodanese-like domain-containing protein [Lewinella sp. IMCC34191]
MKFLLAFLLCASLFACGQTAEPGTTAPDADTPAVSADTYGQLTPEEFAKMMDDENVVLLDVRTPRETAEGVIDGAVELDFRDPDFASKLAELYKEPTYLVYCAAGGRSNQACEMMTEAGFERVYNLDGGYTAWTGR